MALLHLPDGVRAQRLSVSIFDNWCGMTTLLATEILQVTIDVHDGLACKG